MGKGDKKSRRGKIIKGTYGVRRKRKSGKIIMTTLPKEEVMNAEVPVEAETTKEKKTTRTTSTKAAAKSQAKPAVKKTDKEKKPVAKKTAKPASKAKKTDTGKEAK
jgi:30S ribosomal protein S31